MGTHYQLSVDGQHVQQHARPIPVLAQADVVVAGGGPSGVMAAVAAARMGAQVVLVERQAFLGGVATATLMGAFVATAAARGLAQELIDRLIAAGGAPGSDASGSAITGTTPFDIETCKTTLLDMVVDAGVNMFLYTDAVDIIVEGGRARGIIIRASSAAMPF